MAIFRICIVFIVYFTEIPRNVGADVAEVKGSTPKGEPTDWFISRAMWGANNYSDTEETDVNEPLRLVIIYDTLGPRCHSFFLCGAELRHLQSYYHRYFNFDIRYNFLIGSDGKVYEGRGWKVAGDHTKGYDRCSLGLAFMGDYSEDWSSGNAQVTELQQQRAQLLFEEGVRLGHLSPNFHVLGAKDLQDIYSPGIDLYRAIKGWSNYDHENLYKNRTCDEIQQL